MGMLVAIVGRPNVGKSTLFNRLVERREAIVDPTSGVTRDRHYGKSEWAGRHFSVIDTGGYIVGSEDVFEMEIRRQVEIAMEEADKILFVVDATTGITDPDEGVADMLRRIDKPVFVAANKVDSGDAAAYVPEFYAFGLGEVYPISSANGMGTGELLDAIVEGESQKEEKEQSDKPRIAIVGRPNVGKSSLINALLGEQRNIVTPVAGTTRDPLHSDYKAYGFDMTLLDTAGIRKRSKVHENIEFYSVMRSIRAIENSDVCILMLDAEQGIEKQDLNIFYVIERNSKGVVVLVNKWDLIEKETSTMKAMEDKIRERLAPFNDVPIIFTSVKDMQRIHKALETAMEVFKNRTKKIGTSKLNDIMLAEIAKNPPPSTKGKYVKVKYATQLPTHAPSFAFFCNLPQYVKEPYKRFIENKLREHFDFTGVPIKVFFRKK